MPPVVFIMLDGLRPDAIQASVCPRLFALQAHSAYTLSAQSLVPPMPLPCHLSIFHSVPPSHHGVTDNLPDAPAKLPRGLFELLRAKEKRAGAFYNWEPLRRISQIGSLYTSYFQDNYTDFQQGDARVCRAARVGVHEDGLDFAFVYFGSLDAAGHLFGWMSEGYLSQLQHLDGILGRFLDDLPPGTRFLIHSDHGGHEHFHGDDIPEDMTIPWLASGEGIRQNYVIQQPVNLLHTAPTLAVMLGLKPFSSWQGQPVSEIFLETPTA